jgi:hypothetical protein
MRVCDACRGDCAADRRAQALRTYGGFDEFGCACAGSFHRHAHVVIASDGDDRETDVTRTDLPDQGAQTAIGQVHGRHDATARAAIESTQQLGRALKVEDVDIAAGDVLREMLPLDRRRRNDVNSRAQQSLVVQTIPCGLA